MSWRFYPGANKAAQPPVVALTNASGGSLKGRGAHGETCRGTARADPRAAAKPPPGKSFFPGGAQEEALR